MQRNAQLTPLISVGGVDCVDYANSGQLRPTPFLLQSPALLETLQGLGLPLGRCWLVQEKDALRVEDNFHWYRYQPNYLSLSPTETVVYETRRVPRYAISARNGISGCIEPYHFDVLTPDEFAALSAEILANLIATKSYQQIATAVHTLQTQWQTTFDKYGYDRRGELAYQDLVIDLKQRVAKPAQKYPIAHHALNVITTMLQPAPPKKRNVDWQLLKRQRSKEKLMMRGGERPVFDRPIFILSTPRAGSTLLFETLSQLPDLWTIGIESHETIEGIPALHPAAYGWDSNRLIATDATSHVIETLKNRFTRQLENRDGALWLEHVDENPSVRFLEKTPKNALRIPFLKAAFPDAKFIYLYRDPRANISSMLEGWRTLRFLAYSQVKGWPYKSWNFLLTPGWRELADKPLVEIVAHQWRTTQQIIRDDLATIDPCDWLKVDYANLVAQPAAVVRQIAAFADLRWDKRIEQRVGDKLPVSRMVLSAPDPEKWRRHEAEIEKVGFLVDGF